MVFSTFVSESDDEKRTENSSGTESTITKSSNETSGEENNSDFELFASQLRKSGYGATEKQMKEQTRLVIEEWIQPRVKFVEDSILQHNGIIAKVMMKKLPQYGNIKIDSDTWKIHWSKLQKMIRLQISTFKSSKSQHLGRILIGKLRICISGIT